MEKRIQKNSDFINYRDIPIIKLDDGEEIICRIIGVVSTRYGRCYIVESNNQLYRLFARVYGIGYYNDTVVLKLKNDNGKYTLSIKIRE